MEVNRTVTTETNSESLNMEKQFLLMTMSHIEYKIGKISLWTIQKETPGYNGEIGKHRHFSYLSGKALASNRVLVSHWSFP